MATVLAINLRKFEIDTTLFIEATMHIPTCLPTQHYCLLYFFHFSTDSL